MVDVSNVSSGESIDDATIGSIIDKINSEELRRGYDSGNPPTITEGTKITASDLNSIIAKIDGIDDYHCDCDGDIGRIHEGCTSDAYDKCLADAGFSSPPPGILVSGDSGSRFNKMINDINTLANATIEENTGYWCDCEDQGTCSCTTNNSSCVCEANTFICDSEPTLCSCNIDPYCDCNTVACPSNCSCTNTCTCTSDNCSSVCSCTGVCSCNLVRVY